MVTRTETASGRAFARLGDILLQGMDIHRCAAATALGGIACPGTGGLLRQALLDEDEDVRVDAIAALLKLEDPQTADAIMENLVGDPCPEVKLSAIEMLAAVGHSDAVPWLHKMVAGRSEDIKWDDGEYFSSGWDDWLDIQLAAIRALGKIGTAESVAVIIDALENEEGQDVAQFAIPALAQLGDEGIAALASLYASGDARLRRRVCSVLVPGQSAEGDALLSQCMTDKAGEVRLAALEKTIENDPEDERLVAYLDDEDADVRLLIVKAIAAQEPERAIAGLSDKSPRVRQAIFRSIAASPDAFEKEGFTEVVRQAIAGVPEVASDAAVAWAALIGEASAESLGGALQDPEQPLAFRLGLIEALMLLDDSGLPYLVGAIGSSERQVRISALSAVAEIAAADTWPNPAGDSLLAALRGDLVEPVKEDEGPQEEDAEEDSGRGQSKDQPEATSTLDRILQEGIRTEPEPEPEDELEPEEIELSGEDEKFLELSRSRAMKKGKVSLDIQVPAHLDVRRFAACLLGNFEGAELTRALSQALEEDDVELKQSCLESLALIGRARGKLKKRLYGAIAEATHHDDSLVRMHATRCLAFIKGRHAQEMLIELCSDEDVHVRREAITALGCKKGNEDILLAALDDEYSGVRTAAARALCGHHAHMDALIELTLAYDGMHRQEIVAGFKGWNSNEAAEKYLKILNDETRKRVWLVAIAALGDLFSHSPHEDIQAVA